jgi:hypothetical protein
MKTLLTLVLLISATIVMGQQSTKDTCTVTIPAVLSMNMEKGNLMLSDCVFSYFELTIMSRWGNEMLKLREYDPNYVLDLTAKEKDAEKWLSGTYAYKLTYARSGGVPVTQSGFITIIK